MIYIFNSSNICIASCSTEPNKGDIESRGGYFIEAEGCSLGDSYYDGRVIPKALNYESTARSLRDDLRGKIDKFLLPASTINDTLVTNEQKQTLIQDSLLLAAWPATGSWPYVPFPVLSDLCQSLITIPSWTYPEQQ